MTRPVTLTAAQLRATAADDEPRAPRKPIRRAPTLQVTGTTPEQQARWKDAAAQQGYPTLAAWMRAACDKFASSDT